MADVDGNGRADIVGFGNKGVYVSRFNTDDPDHCTRQLKDDYPDGSDYDFEASLSLCVFD